MTAFASPQFLLVPGFFVAIAGVSLAVVIVARRGRGPLRLAAPRCGGCGHSLADISARCPECGVHASARPPIYGQRRCSPRWIAASLGMAIAAVLLIGMLAGKVQGVVGLPWIRRPHQGLDLPALVALIAEDPGDRDAARELLARAPQAASTGELAKELTLAFKLRGGGVQSIPTELSATLSNIRAAGLPDEAWWELMEAMIEPPAPELRRRHRGGRQIAVRLPCPFWGGTDTGTAMVEGARLDGQALPIALGGLAQYGRPGVALIQLPSPAERGALAGSAATAGPRMLELDWVQMVGPAAMAPTSPALGGTLDTSSATWHRRGRIELPIEIVDAGRTEGLFEPVTGPERSPWPGGLSDIGYLEIRELGDRSLVVFDAPPHRHTGMAVVGTWALRQGDRSIPLGQTVVPNVFSSPAQPSRTSMLVEPAIDLSTFDAGTPLALEFRPDPNTAERHTAVDALWMGHIDIPLRRSDLRLDGTGGVRAWVHRGRFPADAPR